MRKFHSIAALCGHGLRPELQALFDRLAVDPYTELFIRPDGMTRLALIQFRKAQTLSRCPQSEWPNLKIAVACFGLERTSVGGHFPSDEGRMERETPVPDLPQDRHGQPVSGGRLRGRRGAATRSGRGFRGRARPLRRRR
jgi:hypothetical protein